MNIEEQQVIVEPTKVLKDVSLDDGRLDRTTRIGTQSSLFVHKELTLFLRNNLDVFTWSHEDMPGIDSSTMVHRLNVSPSFFLVRQKKSVFTQERDKVIAEEVLKLLEAGFIIKVYYPKWLANVAMVKKANGKWRMCVDLTDLNKDCLNNSYPFLRINLLIDLTVGQQLLSFMDSFSGYNQIKLDDPIKRITRLSQVKGLFATRLCHLG